MKKTIGTLFVLVLGLGLAPMFASAQPECVDVLADELGVLCAEAGEDGATVVADGHEDNPEPINNWARVQVSEDGASIDCGDDSYDWDDPPEGRDCFM